MSNRNSLRNLIDNKCFERFLIYFSDTISKDWRQNLCTESRTVFAAHPEDCSKFFICHAHRAFPIDCAAGTLYDKNLKICTHAYAVDCEKEPLKTTPETIKITKETSMTTIESTTTTKDPTMTTTELATTILEPTSEKTDPCLVIEFGVNPRDAVIGLDPKCEENFQIISETDLTEEDFDYIFEERFASTNEDVLKAEPTTTEIIKTTVKEETTSSEKTDSSPCLKKVIGINPRDAILDLDSNCEENLTIPKSKNPPTPPLPPCKFDIRLGDPESDYDITFDTEKCDPTITTTKSATTITEPTTTMTESTTTITKSTTNNTEPTETIETTGLLPPCKLDIRFDYPESDITFDTEMCDPLHIDSAKIDMNK